MKQGYKVFDSDMHIIEPPYMWERYIDPKYKSMAPRGIASEKVIDLRFVWPGDHENMSTTGSPRSSGTPATTPSSR